jgi:hypothetical protein
MDQIITEHPDNIAIQCFKEKEYAKMSESHQMALMRCISPAVSN